MASTLSTSLRISAVAAVCTSFGLASACSSVNPESSSSPRTVAGVTLPASSAVAKYGIESWVAFLGRTSLVVTGLDATGNPVAGLEFAGFDAAGSVPAHLRYRMLDGSGATLRHYYGPGSGVASDDTVGLALVRSIAEGTTCPSCSDPGSSDLSVDPNNGAVSVVAYNPGQSTAADTDAANDGHTFSATGQLSEEGQDILSYVIIDLLRQGSQGAGSTAGIGAQDLAAGAAVTSNTHPLGMFGGQNAACFEKLLPALGAAVGTGILAEKTALALVGCDAAIMAAPATLGWSALVAAWACTKALTGVGATIAAGAGTWDLAKSAWQTCTASDKVACGGNGTGTGTMFASLHLLDDTSGGFCPVPSGMDAGAGMDAGSDSGQDGGADGGTDGGSDGGADGGSDGGTGSEAGAEGGAGDGGYASMPMRSERHHRRVISPAKPAILEFTWTDVAGLAPPADLSIDVRGQHVVQIASVTKAPFLRSGLDVVTLRAGQRYRFEVSRGDGVIVVRLLDEGGVVYETRAPGSASAVDIVLPGAGWRSTISSDLL
jgi:hypothetical protein